MRGTRIGKAAPLLVAAAAVCSLLAACGGGNDNTSSSGSASGATTAATSATKAAKIGLLLPEIKTTRYEQHDRPTFTNKVKELCPSCKVIYQNANQDAQKQQTQADAMLANGVKVLVLDAVDPASVGPIVKEAQSGHVPVIAYDRLISKQPIAYYVSFDNVRQGRIQAQSLVDGLGGKGKPIVMINGAPSDPSAGDYKKGAHEVFDKNGVVKIAKEFDNPDWSPDKAQREMEQAITALGKSGFAGVYSANDGMASGAIAAMKSAGIDPTTRPISGGDAEVAAIQRILRGSQYSTIYLRIKDQAEKSAEIAADLATGKQVPPDLASAKVDNGFGPIPSVLLTPIALTKKNIADTVIKDGFYKLSDICTTEYAKDCKAAGLM